MFRQIIAGFGLAALLIMPGLGTASETGWERLLDPRALAALMQGDEVTILDIRSRREYATAHIPGAVHAPYGMWRGSRDNPGRRLSDAALTKRMQSLGLEHDDRVIVTYAGVNETDFGAAARVYWTLKSAGLTEIAILNGGVRSWVGDGRALSVEPVTPEPSEASFTLSDRWMITREGVRDVLGGARQSTMIDARPAAFFKAKRKHPAATRPGTLEGALNITHDTWFPGSNTQVAPVQRVKALAKEAGYSGSEGELVSFCNTGHWAATNWFALSEIAGAENVKLYPESMVGWSRSGGAMTAGE